LNNNYLKWKLKGISNQKRKVIMPYHKDKQQAYQAAEQGYHHAIEVSKQLNASNSEYGVYYSHFMTENEKARQQIENALETASEHQHSQLKNYLNELEQLQDQFPKP
jgi:biopolymer transport protein ExbB/TolQ